MKMKNIMARSSTAIFIAITATASTLAQATLIDLGGGMIYDDTLNVTWLQNANYAETSGYDDTLYGTDTGGAMTWADATVWASNLNYGGYSDWRLSDVTPSVNELASVRNDFTTSGFDPFINHLSRKFITGSTLSTNGMPYAFETKFGNTFTTQTHQKYQAWAVRDGRGNSGVNPVPEPGTLVLLSLGLFSLTARTRKKRRLQH